VSKKQVQKAGHSFTAAITGNGRDPFPAFSMMLKRKSFSDHDFEKFASYCRAKATALDTPLFCIFEDNEEKPRTREIALIY
jgi:hypothetical protein